jgi:hypothetical protein
MHKLFSYMTDKLLRWNRIILLFVLIILFANDRVIAQVKVDYDTHVDFKKFKTYAWLAPGDSVLNRDRPEKLFGGSILHDANKELQGRGMKLVKEHPEAVFMFFTSVDEITRYSQSPTLSIGVGVGGPGYYVSGAAPVAGGKITSTIEQEGALKYVMYDTETGKMVWSGEATKTFKLSDDIMKIISDYTIRIFKKYPIKKSR